MSFGSSGRPEQDACDVQSGHVDGCGLLVGVASARLRCDIREGRRVFGPQLRRHERLQRLRPLSPGPLCPCLIHTGPSAGLGVGTRATVTSALAVACPRGPGACDQAEKPGRPAAIPCPEQKTPERSLRNQVCGQDSGVPRMPSRRPPQSIGHGLQSADRCPGRALTVKVGGTLPHPERGAASCHSRSQAFRLATGLTTACARCACVSTGFFGRRSVSRSRQNFITPRRTLLSCCWNCARQGRCGHVDSLA